MATSRFSTNTTLSSSKNERRQVQARIRALQQRTSKFIIIRFAVIKYDCVNFIDALYEELTRSSSVANTAVYDIERAYTIITNEFQDQRDYLLRRIHHVKQSIQQ